METIVPTMLMRESIANVAFLTPALSYVGNAQSTDHHAYEVHVQESGPDSFLHIFSILEIFMVSNDVEFRKISDWKSLLSPYVSVRVASQLITHRLIEKGSE